MPMELSELGLSGNKGEAFQVMVMSETENLQKVKAFTNSSSDTPTFRQKTSIIELFSTQDCWVRLVRSTNSSTAAAVSTGSSGPSVFVPGGITKFFGLPRIESVLWKLAVVRDSTDGTLYVTEGA